MVACFESSDASMIIFLLGLPVLTLSVCFSQGDRGYEGPKGSRGPPGVGYKGDKVGLTAKHGWDC